MQVFEYNLSVCKCGKECMQVFEYNISVFASVVKNVCKYLMVI